MKIGVIGSINMDMVVNADRIPRKGETILGNSLSYNAGGKGSNQAVSIAKLGGNVVMFGAVGDDDNGKQLVKSMKENGVNTDFIKVIPNENTGLAIITTGENDNCIVVISGANAKVDVNYVQSIKNELISCDIVIMQHEIPLQTNEYVVELCIENGIKTLLNPAPAEIVSKDLIDKLDYLTPNEHEADIIFGEKNIECALKKYKEKLIITQGENGVIVADKNGDIVNVPARKSNVVDTTGAGDTFNGAFAFALMQGYELEKALEFANIAAGISTEKAGAQNGMPHFIM